MVIFVLLRPNLGPAATTNLSASISDSQRTKRYALSNMLLSTTSAIPAHTITAHHGMVISQVTAGRHIGKDLLAGARDLYGGRSKSLEKDLKQARRQALTELASQAQRKGANGVVGIRLDMENVAGSMLLFVGQGTAVTAVQNDPSTVGVLDGESL